MSVKVELKCKDHPRYQARRQTKTGCIGCDFIYEIVEGHGKDYIDGCTCSLEVKRL